MARKKKPVEPVAPRQPEWWEKLRDTVHENAGTISELCHLELELEDEYGLPVRFRYERESMMFQMVANEQVLPNHYRLPAHLYQLVDKGSFFTLGFWRPLAAEPMHRWEILLSHTT